MALTYYGFPVLKPGDPRIVPLVYKGHVFPAGVAADVRDSFLYLIGLLDKRVEPIGLGPLGGDEWGYSYRENRNASNWSNHAAGRAIDFNATRHPNGVAIGRTFTTKQIVECRMIEAELDYTVAWGGNYKGVPDSMHWEQRKSAAEFNAAVARHRARYAPKPKEWDEVASEKEVALAVVKALGAAFSGQANTLIDAATAATVNRIIDALVDERVNLALRQQFSPDREVSNRVKNLLNEALNRKAA